MRPRVASRCACRDVIAIFSSAEISLYDGKFTINHKATPTGGMGQDRNFYNLDSNRFHKVDLMCLSPNHWGDNKSGNKHYMFMLDGARSQKSMRGFHNENLNKELVTEKEVMEMLGDTTMVESALKELSGLGFDSTVRDEVILKVGGSTPRIIKVKF